MRRAQVLQLALHLRLQRDAARELGQPELMDHALEAAQHLRVEGGQAPDSVVASARGTGNAAGANADVPATWSATRTRPLCAYPKVAKYKGSGSIETADSFSCQ